MEALAFAVIEMRESDRLSRAYAANAYEDEEEDENPNNYASSGDIRQFLFDNGLCGSTIGPVECYAD